MGSDTALKLPIVDFSNVDLEASTPEWEAVKSQVHKALVQYGCFEALFDKVFLELQKALVAALQELYDLPIPTKQRHANIKPYHGYSGHTPRNQLHESMGFEDPCVYDNVESLTNILWPQGNPGFSNTIQSFSEQLSTLDRIIRKMIFESFGVEKYLEEHMNSTYYLLRTMKYLGPQTNDAKVGLPRHTDKSTLTILCQNQVDGFQVETKDGQRIKHKPSSSHSFVVIAGETFYAWSNGRVHAPYHQVMMSGNETRYSCGLFTMTKEGHVVKTPDELVDEEHPLLFKPFVFSEFMRFLRTSENAHYGLKAYCGVPEM